MKDIRTVLTSLLLLFCFFSGAFASQVEFTQAESEFIKEHPVIHLGVDPQFVPYEFFDTDGQYKGIAADYIKLISERTGLIIEIEHNLTWTEAYEKAVERKLDALPCVSKTPEREQYFLYSKPYYSFQRVVVVKENNNSVAKLEDLFNKKIAVKKDSAHHSYLKSFNSIEFSLYPSEEAALKAVANGQETYFVGNLATSSYLIKTNGLTNLKYVQITTDEKQYLYFAVRKDWPELQSIINKALDSITEAEKIEINNRWIGIENKADYSAIIKTIGLIGAVIAGVFFISLYWIIRLRREVRERIKVEEALKVAKEEAESANQIKSSFLARMSHEIRTPLNAITGMAYLLKKTNISVTQSLYLDKITQASRSMLGIINDILDFSKIEAGKIELERLPLSLDRVLQHVIDIVSFNIEEQGIDFILKKDPGVPVYFYGDPTRLEQILLNIINNAVKFTRAGEVAVTVCSQGMVDNMCLLEIVVKDTGIGMTREQLDRLFKPFDQGDSTINRRFGGTGLGLSIVKSLVEIMGGDIQVESSPGEGACFTVILPLEIDRQKEEEENRKSTGDYLKNLRVLVLEKNATYAGLLEEYLCSFGMRPEIASSEVQAAQLLQQAAKENGSAYDLLIVDHDTPRAGGIEFVARIKADPMVGVQPRIILLIPLSREELFEKLGASGIDLGITKPIIASVLYNGIIEVFSDRIKGLHRPAGDKDQPVHFVTNHPYHVLVIEDNKTNQFIAQTILEQAGFKVSLADNGKTGYEMFRGQKDDIDLILMDLHMPVMNGYESAGLIRQLNPSVPIIAMTADAIAGVEEKCRLVGIEHYISKPFEPEQFALEILNALQPLNDSVYPAEEEKTDASGEARLEMILDEDKGIKLLGNNPELYLMVIKEFYHENLGVLENLKTSIDAKRYRDGVQIVHKIKSSSGNIGAKRLIKAASELQAGLEQGNPTDIEDLYRHFARAYSELFNIIRTKITI